MKPLNLASHPFRNERLPTLLVGLLALGTAALTVAHSVTLARVLPSHLQQTESEAVALASEAGRLRAERDQLRSLKPEKQEIERWDVVRDLVDRRLFRWTDLFARLGQIVPEGVTLTAIEPVMQADGAEVRLSAETALPTTKPLLDLVRRLEEQPDFESAVPVNMSKEERGHALSLHVRYRPVAERGTAAAAASPTPEQAR